MNAYRVCILDPDGRVLLSRMADCADDLTALGEAEQDSPGHPVEVWQGGRLVARVKAGNSPLDEKDATCL
jgi:hypothetical protein